MAERTAQCTECTNVFECSSRGKLPSLCPSCKEGAKQRAKSGGAGGSKKKPRAARRAAVAPVAVDYEAIAESIRAEIESMEAQIQVRRDALEALDALVAA